MASENKKSVEDRLTTIEQTLADNQLHPSAKTAATTAQSVAEVDFGGFDNGSADFLYPRAESDANKELVRVTVPAPPHLVSGFSSKGAPIVTPEAQKARFEWMQKYLPEQAAGNRGLDTLAEGEADNQPAADHHSAKVRAYEKVTGYLPPAPPASEKPVIGS